MAKRLAGLSIKRISLVDEPASAPSRVVLYKSVSKEAPMADPEAGRPDWAKAGDTEDDCAAMAGMSETERDAYRATQQKCKEDAMDMAKRLEELKTEVAALEVTKAALDTEIKAKQTAEATTEEELAKCIADPAVRALVTKARADAATATETLAKMQEAADIREYVEKAKAFDALTVKAEDFGPILKRVKSGKTTEADCVELTRVLTAANAAVKSSGVFTEHGRPGNGASDDASDVNVTIEKRAAELVKTEKLSTGDALSRVFNEDPALYQRYLKNVAYGPAVSE